MDADVLATITSNEYIVQLYNICGNIWTVYILLSLYSCLKWKKFDFCMVQVSILIVHVMNLINMKIKPIEGMKKDANKELIILVIIGFIFVAVDLKTGDDCDNHCGKMAFNVEKLKNK